MTATYALTDTATMLRRNLLRFRRYPSISTMIILTPIILLLMFNFFFGGALKGAIGGDSQLGGKYVNYLVPGMILMIPAFMLVAVAVFVCTDMTKGIVKRFRTMSVSPSSILTGHVVGALIQAMISVTVLVLVALIIGFRPNATPVEWLAAAGLFALTVFGFVWLAVGFGIAAKTPESASNLPMPIMMLPYLGSGIVPTGSMPTGVRQFAEYQPFSPIAQTLRGLLMGTPIGNSGIIAVAWCLGIAAIGYVWSTTAFRRKTAG